MACTSPLRLATMVGQTEVQHETLVEHMEVRVTKAMGGGRWSKELPPITLTSNFSALNAVSNIQSALTNGVDGAAQHADVVLVNMGLWWMCALMPLHGSSLKESQLRLFGVWLQCRP